MYLCSVWHLFYVEFSNELFIGPELVLFYPFCLLPKVSFDFVFSVAKPVWNEAERWRVSKIELYQTHMEW